VTSHDVWKNEKDKRIIYVHAVCKKTGAEDPNDAAEARRIYDGIGKGGRAITPFDFPTG
jgi:hypothetical protein